MAVFGKFWSIMVGFVLIFVCPVYIAEMRNAMLTDIALLNAADNFLDRVKYSGYIDRAELEKFYTEISVLSDRRQIRLTHRRRAVRPVFEGDEIVDSKEFYIEVSADEIKSRLSAENKYKFKIGDEVSLVIYEEERGYPFFRGRTLELGGMIENEYIKS